MGYSERSEIYQKIEDKRERPLISYVTSIRQNASGQMASDVISQFAKQILEIPEEKNKIDVLIISNGGDPTVSWRIISMLRERFDEIGALIPYTAYSAATLFALGADEILMHPFSNLGPVDPQIPHIIPGRDGNDDQQLYFGSEELRNFLEFVKQDVGISDQEQLERSFELVSKEIGAIPIGVAKRSSQLSLSMGEQLLKLHMDDDNKARGIAEALSTSYYHHGYPVGRAEAEKIGLKVIKPAKEEENLLWDVWIDIEEEMLCNKPFNPVELAFDEYEKSSSTPTPTPTPPGQPQIPQIIQMFNQFVDFELFLATLESTRCRSEFRSYGKIHAAQIPDMRINTSVIPTSAEWKFFRS